jgi:rubrerythrin
MSNDIGYDLDALKVGVEKCHNNVNIFEAAIEREYATIRRYKRIIAQLENKKALANVNKN